MEIIAHFLSFMSILLHFHYPADIYDVFINKKVGVICLKMIIDALSKLSEYIS